MRSRISAWGRNRITFSVFALIRQRGLGRTLHGRARFPGRRPAAKPLARCCGGGWRGGGISGSTAPSPPSNFQPLSLPAEEISIGRLKLDGAHVHEASGKVVWDLEVKAGEQVERILKYVIQSPRELMVLAD